MVAKAEYWKVEEHEPVDPHLRVEMSPSPEANVTCRPRLLSDNGSCYVAGDLVKWMKDHELKRVRGAPYHPMTQGKVERWHQTLMNRILLEHYYTSGELEQAIANFVDHYNPRSLIGWWNRIGGAPISYVALGGHDVVRETAQLLDTTRIPPDEFFERSEPMLSFSLHAEQEFSPVKHVEKILGTLAGGDFIVACWEPRQISPNHCHPKATEIYFCLEGGGIMKTPTETVDVKPGAFVVHPPGEVHEYINGAQRTLLFRVRYGEDMGSRHLNWPSNPDFKQSPEDEAYFQENQV